MTSASPRAARTLGTALAALWMAACAAGAPGPRTVEFRGPTMGTSYSVKVVTGTAGLDAAARAAVEDAIRTELTRINALMSTWDPESELSRFNGSASVQPMAVSPETFEVFRWAADLAQATGGALDVTMAPLVDAWGFGPRGTAAHAPPPDEIARLRALTGPAQLELDAAARTVRKARPGVRCDFSALAPGYAADRIWDRLEGLGLSDYLIDVGGELRARGRNDQRAPWQIAVERPASGARRVARMVAISDLAIATSGDYRNYHEVDGARVTHILDPRTGRPIRHRLASVTVVDRLAVRADGLSTALMVLGPDDGYAMAERLDLAALFIVRDDAGGFTERATARFEALTRPSREDGTWN